ncbi:MAG: hypothetical protein ACOCSQ_02775, partial [Planctomycetota bacterium]
PETISTAECIWGPSTPRGCVNSETVTWTERNDGDWALMLFSDGRKEPVFESSSILRNPSAALVENQTFLACEQMGEPPLMVRLFDHQGNEIYQTIGRSPRLVGMDHRVAMLVEKPAPDTCDLELTVWSDGVQERCVTLPRKWDLHMNGSMVWDRESSLLWIAHEAAPGWGLTDELSSHRDIYLWSYDPATGEVSSAPDTGNGRIPLPMVSSFNLQKPWIQPQVILRDGEPEIVLRRYRFDKVWPRPYKWDLYLTRRRAGEWVEPGRLTPNGGPGDVDYRVLSTSGDRLLLFVPCLAPESPARYRTDILRCDAGTNLGETDLSVESGHYAGTYSVRQGIQKAALSPPDTGGGSPSHLVWADMHQHSALSGCQAPVDGFLEENLRFQRDTLGCRVFTLGEHNGGFQGSMLRRFMDTMEAEAGDDGIVIYGSEPGGSGHDTNYYTLSREVFRRMLTLFRELDSPHHRDKIRAIAEHFDPREVAVIRHYHGQTQESIDRQYDGDEHPGPWGVDNPRCPETFAAELEPAMEAMQVRGNVMLESGKNVYGGEDNHPRFPSNFLNGGCRLGFVGGSDHNRGAGRNHFALTGFWVDEITPEAVWDALWNRRTIATSNGKLAVWATCGEAELGRNTGVEGDVRLNVSASCASGLKCAYLIKDGTPQEPLQLTGRTATFELDDPSPAPGPHWYCVTVEGHCPYDRYRPIVCHASPVFVDCQ